MSRARRLMANGLWVASCLPESVRFRRAAARVAATQNGLLMRLLRANASTEFGRRYNFASITSPAEYQARVPMQDYSGFADDIARLGAGAANLLTAEPVLLLEPTSGSATTAKLIPYTAALRAEFGRGIAPWVTATALRHPRVLQGTAYWSVSPVLQQARHTAGGVPIGFDDDSAYAGNWQRRLVDAVMAVPGEVKQINDLESFRYVTRLFLVRSGALALISVWNPTFFLLLVEELASYLPQLADDIAAGTLTPPAPLDDRLHAILAGRLLPDPARAADVRRALADARSVTDLHRALWPGLRLISCWADGQAGPYARELAARFPQAHLQPKGLLATEGIVSIPLDAPSAGAGLAIRAHFFEFAPVAGDGEPHGRARPSLAHELESGSRYVVILTTGGGLYRYCLQDIVEVVGHWRELPLLRFVGRADAVVDHFGEKLHAAHVSRVLDDALARHGIAPAFVLLACADETKPPRYTLYIEADCPLAVLDRLAATVEKGLCSNFHYAYCRQIGQLGSVAPFPIAAGGRQAYLDGCVARGQRAGDVKPAVLDKRRGWSADFQNRA